MIMDRFGTYGILNFLRISINNVSIFIIYKNIQSIVNIRYYFKIIRIKTNENYSITF